jgi:hypothetical protein
MTRAAITSALLSWLTIVASACGQTHQGAKVLSVSPQWCVPEGRQIDSVFIVEQAARALVAGTTTHPVQLSPDTILHVYSRHGIHEGAIVRLLLTKPQSMRGGGGLVWVDMETGCPTVLRRYE